MSKRLLLNAVLVLLFLASCAMNHASPCANLQGGPFRVRPEWLTVPTSFAEVEARDAKTRWPLDGQAENDPKWAAFKHLASQGDELWVLETPWLSGYALVRGCEIVEIFPVVVS